MKVLVTGAAGLLGSHVAELALERGDDVRVMVRLGEDVSWLAEAGAEVCWGDMSDATSLQAAVHRMDCVVNCAARMTPWGPETEYYLVNVRGPQILAEAAIIAGVQKIIHISSVDVQGLVVGDGSDETAAYGTERDPYCRSKIAGERVLQQLIRDQEAPITIIRPGIIYGPRDTNSFYRFAKLVEQGKMAIIGAGTNHIPLIYVKDVVQAILLASEATQANGKAYIVVDDEPITQQDYFNIIAQELGVPPPRWHIPYRLALTVGATSEMIGHALRMKQPPPLMRFGMIQLAGENRFVINRARSELGFSPQVTLTEGVRESVSWYRSIPHMGNTRIKTHILK